MKFKFWSFIVTCIAVIILMRLGFWQLERAEQKQQALVLLQQQQELGINQLLSVKDIKQVHSRRVKLKAKLNRNKVWLLDNRVYQGQVGYSLITEVIPKGTEQILLVDWGWIKAPKTRAELPVIKLPEREVTLSGLIKSQDFAQVVLKETKEQGWPRRIQSLQELNLARGVIYADSGILNDMVQIYKPVVMPPEKHKAYALQWFLLALACVLVYLFASRNRIKEKR